MKEKTYIKLANSLPEGEKIEKAIAVCFFDGDLVMIDSHTNGLKFPAIKLEPSEAPERTVRRDVYGMTGALLRENSLLGVLHLESRGRRESVAVYVGDVACLENTPLIPDNYHRAVMDVETVYQWLSRSQYDPVKDFLLYHAYELYKKIHK